MLLEKIMMPSRDGKGGGIQVVWQALPVKGDLERKEEEE